MSRPLKIAISAGELSGDEHGANLMRALRAAQPGAEFRGMGLRNLKGAGMELVVDATKSGGVMGFTEVLGGLTRVFGVWKKMTTLLKEWRPDILVIINYSEFNLRLAKFAKPLGIRVVFYIPPQVWAWRPGRVKTIDRYVDSVICIFPFERKFYEARGCTKAVYVGHPFVDQAATWKRSSSERVELLNQSGLDPNRPVIALFPGSRRKEILNHLELMCASFSQVYRERPDVQGLLVAASRDWVDEFQSKIDPRLPIKVVYGDSLAYLQTCAAGMIKSGTSNLQALFCHVPFVMFFKVSKLTERLVKLLAPHMNCFSIVNILRPSTIVECAAAEVDPSQMARETLRLLNDSAYRKGMLDNFAQIERDLSTPDSDPRFSGCTSASERAAKLVLDF